MQATEGGDCDVQRQRLALACSADDTSLVRLTERVALTFEGKTGLKAVDAFVRSIYGARNQSLNLTSFLVEVNQCVNQWIDRMWVGLHVYDGCPSIIQQRELLASMGQTAVVTGVLQLVLVALVQLVAIYHRAETCGKRGETDKEYMDANAFYTRRARVAPMRKDAYYANLCRVLLGGEEKRVPFGKVTAACFVLWTRLELGEVLSIPIQASTTRMRVLNTPVKNTTNTGHQLRHYVFEEDFAPWGAGFIDTVADALFSWNGDILLPQWQRFVYGMHGPFPEYTDDGEERIFFIPWHLRPNPGGNSRPPLCGMLTPPSFVAIMSELIVSHGIAAAFRVDGRDVLGRHVKFFPAALVSNGFLFPPSAIIGMMLFVILDDLKRDTQTAETREQILAVKLAHDLLYPAGLSDDQKNQRQEAAKKYRLCVEYEQKWAKHNLGKRKAVEPE